MNKLGGYIDVDRLQAKVPSPPGKHRNHFQTSIHRGERARVRGNCGRRLHSFNSIISWSISSSCLRPALAKSVSTLSTQSPPISGEKVHQSYRQERKQRKKLFSNLLFVAQPRPDLGNSQRNQCCVTSKIRCEPTRPQPKVGHRRIADYPTRNESATDRLTRGTCPRTPQHQRETHPRRRLREPRSRRVHSPPPLPFF